MSSLSVRLEIIGAVARPLYLSLQGRSNKVHRRSNTYHKRQPITMVIGDALDFSKLTIIALSLIMVTDIDSEQMK